jgi:hypothetical protein
MCPLWGQQVSYQGYPLLTAMQDLSVLCTFHLSFYVKEFYVKEFSFIPECI